MKKIILTATAIAMAAVLVLTLGGCKAETKTGHTDDVVNEAVNEVVNGTADGTAKEVVNGTADDKANEAVNGTADDTAKEVVNGVSDDTANGVNGGSDGIITAEPVEEDNDVISPLRMAGDFDKAGNMYLRDGESGAESTVLAVFSLEDDGAILEFRHIDATDADMPAETTYVFMCERTDIGRYDHTETDQNGDEVNVIAMLDNTGVMNVAVNCEFPVDITGSYVPEKGEPEVSTGVLLEYLRSIPGAEIGDFGLYNPYDEVEETLVSGWIHDLTLVREGEIFARFIVTDDFSLAGKLVKRGELSNMADAYTLDCIPVAGSFESILNHVETYEIYNETGKTYETYEQPLVYPYVTGGPEMVAGTEHRLGIEMPWDLLEAYEYGSSDESIAEFLGSTIIANAPGETVLNITLYYGGCVKDYEIPVKVVEAEEDELNTEVEEVNESDQN